jgi:hypothetical protein
MLGGLPLLPGRSGGGRRCGRLECCRSGSCPRPGAGRWNPAPGTPRRLAITAWLLAGLVLGLVLGLAGCGAGGGSDSATRPTTERSGTRPAPSGTESPNQTTTKPTRPPRTTADTPASTRTPTTAERPNSLTTTPERSAEALTPTSAPTGTPAAAESEGGAGRPRLDPGGPPGGRAGCRLAALEVAPAVGLGTPRPRRWRTTPAAPPAPSCRPC